MDFAKGTDGAAIKTFRLKYIFMVGKIIRTAKSVVMKLLEKYLYQEIYEKSLAWEKHALSFFNLLFAVKLD
jgi:hypothetical protein